MKIYHGTNIQFGAVDLALCPPNRDFGQGFYTTSVKVHAERRAEEAVRKSKGGQVFVMEFDFDMEEVNALYPDLKIKCFKTVCDEWAQFVMFNRLRKESEPPHEYDIVEGPVANDKMFRQFQLYASNRIKLKELIGKLEYRESTHQIAFCTEKALSALLDYNEPARYRIETLVADLTIALIQKFNISKIDAMGYVYNSAIFAQLSESGNKLYRISWQEIFEMLLKELNCNLPGSFTSPSIH